MRISLTIKYYLQVNNNYQKVSILILIKDFFFSRLFLIKLNNSFKTKNHVNKCINMIFYSYYNYVLCFAYFISMIKAFNISMFLLSILYVPKQFE